MMHQIDVNTAFLHADISEENYIAPPEGFPIKYWNELFQIEEGTLCFKTVSQRVV